MRPWIVWATGLLAYIVAVLDRTTLGVSGLDAANRFGASPGVLSTFVVLQVIVYAGAQVPAGLLLDRFGSRALIVAGAALMAAGQLGLAFTESLPVAIAARAVVRGRLRCEREAPKLRRINVGPRWQGDCCGASGPVGLFRRGASGGGTVCPGPTCRGRRCG